MLRISEIKLPLEHAEDELPKAILAKIGVKADELISFTIYKRSYDARRKNAILLVYIVDAEVKDEAKLLKKFANNPHIIEKPDNSYKIVATAPKDYKKRPIIIGTGPCGMFAGLMLAEMGFRPIILERGKSVRERSLDTFGFWRHGTLNPESNAQFGEGGAGTFSDGKLYSQVRDSKYHGRKVLDELVKNGANPEILYVHRPHIGTYKLIKVVETMRSTIISQGGEIRFESRVEDIEIVDGKVKGVKLANGEFIESEHIILAVGHSARDTFEMLLKRNVYIEPKPFSIGFRIEHPQNLIDECRYGKFAGNKILGAADYKLVHHAKNGRSVYSFCMCPGGLVVAAASEENRLVTNGMSQYSRNEKNANSAIVVGITPEEDYPENVLGGVELQRKLEAKAFQLGGETYQAPAQLVGDFLKGVPSKEFGKVEPSYKPGIRLTDLSEALPAYAIEAIREAIPAFDKQIKGFAMNDAILTGVETRTSSPIRIKRDETGQSINTLGLFPAGEGAGYAGGILSAGIDGIKAAEWVALNILEL